MTGFPDEEAAKRQPSSDYTKQNADAELVWRPRTWLNLGASYDWEHWSRSVPRRCNDHEREYRQGVPRLEVGLLSRCGRACCTGSGAMVAIAMSPITSMTPKTTPPFIA